VTTSQSQSQSQSPSDESAAAETETSPSPQSPSPEEQKRSDREDVRRDLEPTAKVEWRDKHGGYADTTGTLQPLMNATPQDWLGSNQDPDVLLAVPNLGVDHIGLVVDNLRAHIELHAKVLDLLELHVGADVSIDKVDLQIDNVRVQAMLKVKLEKVAQIVDRVMDTIDRNPEILTNLTAGLGKGLEAGLGKQHAIELEKTEGRLKGVEKDTDLQQMPPMPS
jgi:hypothetical protein